MKKALLFLCHYLFDTEFRVQTKIKFMLQTKDKQRIIYRLVDNDLRSKYNVVIPSSTSIGSGLCLPHPHNVVIGKNLIIGNNCTLYHDVTIGQNRGQYPQLGNNVIVYTGAKIVGNIKIGNNAIIGANAVVTSDVPESAIVGGIPARVLRYREEYDEFY